MSESWDGRRDRAGEGGGGAVSRPSKTNPQQADAGRYSRSRTLEPHELPTGTARRPISVEPGRGLRDEAVLVKDEYGATSLDSFDEVPEDAELQARPVYSVVNEWRDWLDGYRNAHIEFEDPNGETVRTRLKNSYQPEYGKRYYGKLKGLEREVERQWQDLTTVMLTLSASNKNAEGGLRCPADHMRDIADGWDTAYSLLHHVLDGFRSEFAKVWEPHQSGYGHMHIAVFVEDPAGAISAEQFRPVIRSFVKNTEAAGSEAHDLDTVGMGDTVSVNDGVENLGTYISEYIGIFGEEPTQRPISEQMFYATCWATGTRRVDFSNGAHELMAMDRFRQETGLTPADRGGEPFRRWRGGAEPGQSGSGGSSAGGETDTGGASAGSWSVDAICTVSGRSPTYSDPTAGGQRLTPIDGRQGMDPPAHRE